MFYGKAWDRMPVEAKIRAVKAELQKDMDKWEDIRKNGCNDPFWPDGVNMNLKRNHVIHDLRLLRELECQPEQISMFALLGGEERFSDERIPPKVPNDYMAKERKCNYFQVNH